MTAPSAGWQTLAVHFEAANDFAAPPERVGELMSDPDFQSQLDLPDLSAPTVVAHEVDGPRRLLRLRYQYVGQIDSFAKRIVGNRQLTWVQELRLDVSTGVGELAFSADEDRRPRQRRGDGRDHADGRRRRTARIRGDFRIRIPLVGGTAEKKIVPGLVRRLHVEAAGLAARVAADALSEAARVDAPTIPFPPTIPGMLRHAVDAVG